MPCQFGALDNATDAYRLAINTYGSWIDSNVLSIDRVQCATSADFYCLNSAKISVYLFVVCCFFSLLILFYFLKMIIIFYLCAIFQFSARLLFFRHILPLDDDYARVSCFYSLFFLSTFHPNCIWNCLLATKMCLENYIFLLHPLRHVICFQIAIGLGWSETLNKLKNCFSKTNQEILLLEFQLILLILV